MESMHEKYMRWTMGVNRLCPGYMLREEIGREKLVVRQRKRAWNFEERMRQGKGNRWTQLCWNFIKDREERGVREWSKWEKARSSALNESRKRGRNWVELEEG